MTDRSLHIVVLLREVFDPRPPADVAAEGAAIRNRGLRRIVNPADLVALEEAVQAAEHTGGSVTAVSIGPARVEAGLRDSLAQGAARAVRVWDAGFVGADDVATARVFARVVEILAPSLVFTGARLPDRGEDPVPAVAAAMNGTAYCAPVVSARVEGDKVQVVRRADRGARQIMELPLPCTVLFDDGIREPRYPDLDAVLAAVQAPVESWGLAALGLPSRCVGERGALLPAAGVSFPRPVPFRVVTPDPSLPGHERTLTLLSGGIQPREGRMHFGGAEQAAEGLFRILCQEGLLPEARP